MKDMAVRSTRKFSLSTSVLASLISVFAWDAQAAHAAGSALPSGGHFVAGQGSFARGKGGLTVDQSSTTGIIDWNSFSIGKKASVTIDNGSDATLDRVTGSNPSIIAGDLHATVRSI